MKKILFLITAIILSIGIQAKEKVSVLYVGGSPDINSYGVGTTDSVALARSVKMRTEDFARFLKRHFTKVTAVDGKDYTPAMSDGYDVTIFDGCPTPIRPKIEEYDENGRIIKYARPAYLPDDFDRAVVCIAEASEDMGRSIGTKNDWFCLCLNNYALGWDKQHPIFKGPFKVDIVSEMRPTPEHAKEYCPIYGYTLPEQTEMWLVHKPATPENGMRIGMVSRPGGYLDSPDTEIISGGECAKSIDAVAIGRHGNFFHWGFSRQALRSHRAGQSGSRQRYSLHERLQRQTSDSPQAQRKYRYPPECHRSQIFRLKSLLRGQQPDEYGVLPHD